MIIIQLQIHLGFAHSSTYSALIAFNFIQIAYNLNASCKTIHLIQLQNSNSPEQK